MNRLLFALVLTLTVQAPEKPRTTCGYRIRIYEGRNETPTIEMPVEVDMAAMIYMPHDPIKLEISKIEFRCVDK